MRWFGWHGRSASGFWVLLIKFIGVKKQTNKRNKNIANAWAWTTQHWFANTGTTQPALGSSFQEMSFYKVFQIALIKNKDKTRSFQLKPIENMPSTIPCPQAQNAQASRMTKKCLPRENPTEAWRRSHTTNTCKKLIDKKTSFCDRTNVCTSETSLCLLPANFEHWQFRKASTVSNACVHMFDCSTQIMSLAQRTLDILDCINSCIYRTYFSRFFRVTFSTAVVTVVWLTSVVAPLWRKHKNTNNRKEEESLLKDTDADLVSLQGKPIDGANFFGSCVSPDFGLYQNEMSQHSPDTSFFWGFGFDYGNATVARC